MLLLGLVVVLPATFWGMLFLGPAFDFFGLGTKLPSALVPASFSKSSRAKVVAQAPPQPMPTQPAMPPVTETAPPVQPPVVAAETQAADKPAADAPALPASDALDNAAPPEPPAESVDSLLDEPAKPAADSSPGVPDEPIADTPAQPELPEEMPAEDKEASDVADSAAAELVSPEKPAADEPAEEPASEESPVRDAKEFSLADLATATQAAAAADQNMLAAQGTNSDAELKKARSQFYLSLYRLAEVLTFVKDDPVNPQLSEQQKLLQPIVEQFVGDQKRLDAIKYNAGRWLGYPKRTTQGIMLAGTVQEVEQVGKLYQLKLGIGIESDAPIITVLQNKNPRLNPGDQAYVLGSIVADPAENLAGYEGDEPEIVWSGMTLMVPAAK
jgi:hypothetical protein